MPRRSATYRTGGTLRRAGATRDAASAPSRRLVRARAPLVRVLQPAPSAGAVVGDDLLEHPAQRVGVERLAFVDRNGPGRRVVVAAGDDALGIRHDRAVVEEH